MKPLDKDELPVIDNLLYGHAIRRRIFPSCANGRCLENPFYKHVQNSLFKNEQYFNHSSDIFRRFTRPFHLLNPAYEKIKSLYSLRNLLNLNRNEPHIKWNLWNANSKKWRDGLKRHNNLINEKIKNKFYTKTNYLKPMTYLSKPPIDVSNSNPLPFTLHNPDNLKTNNCNHGNSKVHIFKPRITPISFPRILGNQRNNYQTLFIFPIRSFHLNDLKRNNSSFISNSSRVIYSSANHLDQSEKIANQSNRLKSYPDFKDKTIDILAPNINLSIFTNQQKIISRNPTTVFENGKNLTEPMGTELNNQNKFNFVSEEPTTTNNKIYEEDLLTKIAVQSNQTSANDTRNYQKFLDEWTSAERIRQDYYERTTLSNSFLQIEENSVQQKNVSKIQLFNSTEKLFKKDGIYFELPSVKEKEVSSKSEQSAYNVTSAQANLDTFQETAISKEPEQIEESARNISYKQTTATIAENKHYIREKTSTSEKGLAEESTTFETQHKKTEDLIEQILTANEQDMGSMYKLAVKNHFIDAVKYPTTKIENIILAKQTLDLPVSPTEAMPFKITSNFNDLIDVTTNFNGLLEDSFETTTSNNFFRLDESSLNKKIMVNKTYQQLEPSTIATNLGKNNAVTTSIMQSTDNYELEEHYWPTKELPIASIDHTSPKFEANNFHLSGRPSFAEESHNPSEIKLAGTFFSTDDYSTEQTTFFKKQDDNPVEYSTPAVNVGKMILKSIEKSTEESELDNVDRSTDQSPFQPTLLKSSTYNMDLFEKNSTFENTTDNPSETIVPIDLLRMDENSMKRTSYIDKNVNHSSEYSENVANKDEKEHNSFKQSPDDNKLEWSTQRSPDFPLQHISLLFKPYNLYSEEKSSTSESMSDEPSKPTPPISPFVVDEDFLEPTTIFYKEAIHTTEKTDVDDKMFNFFEQSAENRELESLQWVTEKMPIVSNVHTTINYEPNSFGITEEPIISELMKKGSSKATTPVSFLIEDENAFERTSTFDNRANNRTGETSMSLNVDDKLLDSFAYSNEISELQKLEWLTEQIPILPVIHVKKQLLNNFGLLEKTTSEPTTSLSILRVDENVIEQTTIPDNHTNQLSENSSANIKLKKYDYIEQSTENINSAKTDLSEKSPSSTDVPHNSFETTPLVSFLAIDHNSMEKTYLDKHVNHHSIDQSTTTVNVDEKKVIDTEQVSEEHASKRGDWSTQQSPVNFLYHPTVKFKSYNLDSSTETSALGSTHTDFSETTSPGYFIDPDESSMKQLMFSNKEAYLPSEPSTTTINTDENIKNWFEFTSAITELEKLDWSTQSVPIDLLDHATIKFEPDKLDSDKLSNSRNLPRNSSEINPSGVLLSDENSTEKTTFFNGLGNDTSEHSAIAGNERKMYNYSINESFENEDFYKTQVTTPQSHFVSFEHTTIKFESSNFDLYDKHLGIPEDSSETSTFSFLGIDQNLIEKTTTSDEQTYYPLEQSTAVNLKEKEVKSIEQLTEDHKLEEVDRFKQPLSIPLHQTAIKLNPYDFHSSENTSTPERMTDDSFETTTNDFFKIHENPVDQNTMKSEHTADNSIQTTPSVSFLNVDKNSTEQTFFHQQSHQISQNLTATVNKNHVLFDQTTESIMSDRKAAQLLNIPTDKYIKSTNNSEYHERSQVTEESTNLYDTSSLSFYDYRSLKDEKIDYSAQATTGIHEATDDYRDPVYESYEADKNPEFNVNKSKFNISIVHYLSTTLKYDVEQLPLEETLAELDTQSGFSENRFNRITESHHDSSISQNDVSQNKIPGNEKMLPEYITFLTPNVNNTSLTRQSKADESTFTRSSLPADRMFNFNNETSSAHSLPIFGVKSDDSVTNLKTAEERYNKNSSKNFDNMEHTNRDPLGKSLEVISQISHENKSNLYEETKNNKSKNHNSFGSLPKIRQKRSEPFSMEDNIPLCTKKPILFYPFHLYFCFNNSSNKRLFNKQDPNSDYSINVKTLNRKLKANNKQANLNIETLNKNSIINFNKENHLFLNLKSFNKSNISTEDQWLVNFLINGISKKKMDKYKNTNQILKQGEINYAISEKTKPNNFNNEKKNQENNLFKMKTAAKYTKNIPGKHNNVMENSIVKYNRPNRYILSKVDSKNTSKRMRRSSNLELSAQSSKEANDSKQSDKIDIAAVLAMLIQNPEEVDNEQGNYEDYPSDDQYSYDYDYSDEDDVDNGNDDYESAEEKIKLESIEEDEEKKTDDKNNDSSSILELMSPKITSKFDKHDYSYQY